MRTRRQSKEEVRKKQGVLRTQGRYGVPAASRDQPAKGKLAEGDEQCAETQR